MRTQNDSNAFRACSGLGIVLSILGAIPAVANGQCEPTWNQRSPAHLPSARGAHAMVYNSDRGVTVLFGGSDNNSQLLGDTWEWDGQDWTQKSPSASPSPRYALRMAYDSNRHVTVLFGGASDTGLPTDTWEWDGANWTQKNPATTPPGRLYHGMVYDTARGVTVLFGGQGPTSLFADTWEWNGTNWTQVNPALAPSARSDFAIAYDSNRRVTVLFGGAVHAATFPGTFNGETWEYDGNNWTQMGASPAPSAREDHCMTFDSLHGVVVLFGGYVLVSNNSVVNDELWEWDGTNWTQRNPSLSPAPRQNHALASDANRKVTVCFAGIDIINGDNDTFELSGPEPVITQQPPAKTVGIGESASFTVAADSAAPLSFQWKRNSTSLSDAGAISGAGTATLTINPVGATDSADYVCVVSSTCGTTASNAASLTVDVCKAVTTTGDCDANGTLDTCDIAANPALDSNNNGILDSCEVPAPDPTPAAQSVPCGACGGGTVGMMPAALLAMGVFRRRSRSRALIS